VNSHIAHPYDSTLAGARISQCWELMANAVVTQYWDRLRLTPEKLQQVAHAFQQELEAGLENKSSLLMIPTMVDMLPQG
jgi:hexokinase